MTQDNFINITSNPSTSLVDLLKENVIGTPGKSMCYQHLEVDKKVKHIPNPYYTYLNWHNSIMGTCCFCSRETFNVGNNYPAYYLRYFTFQSKYRSSGNIQESNTKRNSKLRSEIELILQGKGLNANSNDKFFHYAYLDPRNIRSALLCKEFGFETVRSFSTIIFHRMSANEDIRVQLCSERNDLDKMKVLLNEFYKGCTMFSYENLFSVGQYYCIQDENGNVLAGAQVNPDSWKVKELPGLSGKILLNLFTYLPFLNKVINKNYRFLTIEGVYYLPGHEKLLEVLIESLLAKFNLNSAMLWADADSELYSHLRSLDLGLVDKLNKEIKIDIICRFSPSFQENEKEIFKRNPSYVSGFDLT